MRGTYYIQERGKQMKKLITLTLTMALALTAVAVFAGPSMAGDKLNAGDSMFMVPDRFIPVAEPVVKPAGDPRIAEEIAELSNGITDFSGRSYDEPGVTTDKLAAVRESVEGNEAGGPRAVELFKDLYNGITDF